MRLHSMLKRALPALLALCLGLGLFALAACGKTETPQSDTPNSTEPVTPAPTTKTVTDAYGRSVVVPMEVTRVATVGSGARLVVYAGAIDKLVAVTDMETKPAPTRPYAMAYADTFATLPSTSNGNHLNETEVDAEALLALAPDVIISSRSAAECDALQAQSGIPVIGVSYQDDLFGDTIKASIRCTAAACGTETAGEELISAIEGWEADIAARLAKATATDATVYAAGLNFKGSKGFTGTSADYPVFAILGLDNVAAQSGNTSNFDTTVEQILAWDPDYMFVNMANLTKLQADIDTAPGAFAMMTAFKTGNLYSQPSFTYNGTNTELGIADVYWTASVMYPDAFGDCATPEFLDTIISAFLHTSYINQLSEQGLGFYQVDEWATLANAA